MPRLYPSPFRWQENNQGGYSASVILNGPFFCFPWLSQRFFIRNLSNRLKGPEVSTYLRAQTDEIIVWFGEWYPKSAEGSWTHTYLPSFSPKSSFFTTEKGACGNVPALKNSFSQKKVPAATFQHYKAVFSQKNLRQRSSTKNQFFPVITHPP